MTGEPKVGPNRGNAGKGRPPGVPNKTNALLKEAILRAAELAGNKLDDKNEGGLVSYLTVQAEMNPGPFMSLLGKVLPMQVTGEDGGAINIVARIERRIVKPTE